MGELGVLFNPGMRHEQEEKLAKQMLREDEGAGRKGRLNIDLESGVVVIGGDGADDDAAAEPSASAAEDDAVAGRVGEDRGSEAGERNSTKLSAAGSPAQAFAPAAHRAAAPTSTTPGSTPDVSTAPASAPAVSALPADGTLAADLRPGEPRLGAHVASLAPSGKFRRRRVGADRAGADPSTKPKAAPKGSQPKGV